MKDYQLRSAIERIKDECNIADVVKERLGDQKKRNFYNCPFHNERTPSFHVDSTRQTFYCFGCEKGGDVINFVQEYEGISFIDAAKILGESIGVRLEFTREQRFEREKKDKLSDVMGRATKFYTQMLKDPMRGARARDYLKKRGIDSETAGIFRLGYAPDGWDFLLGHLRDAGVRELDIENLGLIKRAERGSAYDVFRDRIIIPITDLHGKVIAFGGRDLSGKDDTPKYLNSSASSLYDKKKVLYGIDFAFKSARTQKELIIQEGYFDVIQSHRQGIENVVSTGGTSLTEEHVQLFLNTFRGCDINLVFDGDNAGQEAAIRAGIKLIGKTPSYIFLLPEGKDPANIVENGENLKDYFEKERRQSFTEFYISKRVSDGDTSDYTGRWKILNEIAREAWPSIPLGDRALFIDELSRSLNVGFDAITSKLLSYQNDKTPKDLGNLEDTLLFQLYNAHINSRTSLRDKLGNGFFSTPEKRILSEYILNQESDFLNDGTLFNDQDSVLEDLGVYCLGRGIPFDKKRMERTVNKVLNHPKHYGDIDSILATMAVIKANTIDLSEIVQNAVDSGTNGARVIKRLSRLDRIIRGAD